MSDIIVGTPKKEQTAPVVVKPGAPVASAVIIEPVYIPPPPPYNPPAPYIPPTPTPTYSNVDIIVGTPKTGSQPPPEIILPTPSTPVASITNPPTTSTDAGPDIIVGTQKTGETAPIVIQPGYSASNLGQAQSNQITLEAQTLIANAQNQDVIMTADSILNKPINVDAYENPEKYNWSKTQGGYQAFKKQYEETQRIKEKALANIAKNSAAMNKYNAEVTVYAAALAANQRKFDEWVAAYDKWKNDSNRVERQAELLSQSTKWTVDGVTYDTYMDAEAAIANASKPVVTRQDLITNPPDYFVDAPGMEDYVKSLGIPTTQSGIRQQGWVDANIDAASASLHRLGRFEEQAAMDTKLAGDNLGAGLRASAAIALGASSALFDAGSWMLNPYPTDAVNMITEFEKNPLFDTGYVGGNVALILYGAGELYSAAGRRMPKVIKTWAQEPDPFIDVAHEFAGKVGKNTIPEGVYDNAEFANKRLTGFGELDENMNPVVTEYNVGSPEYNTNLLMGRQGIAYAMVQLDEPLVTLSRNLSTAARTPYYMLDYPVYSYRGAKAGLSVASLMSALGAASAAKSLLADNQRVITELAPILRTPSITSTLTLPTQYSIQVPSLDTISLTSQIQDPLTITGQVPILDTPTITETITTPITITEQTPIQVQDPIGEFEFPPPPPPPGPPKPTVEPPPDKPKILLLKGGKLTKRETERQRRELRGGDYVVRLRYGRRTVTRVVDAKSFREALSKVLSGHPSEVEVRRRG